MISYTCECCGDSHKLNITHEKYHKLDKLGYVANADCKDARRRIQDGYCNIVFEDENHIAYIHTHNIKPKPQSLWQYFLSWADKTLIPN